MNKIKIHVNDEEMEVDFDTFNNKTAEELGIKFHIDDENSNHQRRKGKFSRKIKAIVPFLVLIAFFLTGFLVEGAWRWNWSFFFLIPVSSILFSIKHTTIKKNIISIVVLLIIAGYIISGLMFHIWTWNWVIFFLIPIVSILLG